MQQMKVGVNLGGWLSQYRKYDHQHFSTFITLKDIQRIAGWGMDHVRLPVDYPLLEWDEAPGVYREDGFQYVDRCLEWCRANGLGLILDLHRAPGYSFANTIEERTRKRNTLFDDSQGQARFVALWEAIARRYRATGDEMAFELLNEVNEPDSGPWNLLARRTVEAVRAIDPQHAILVGPNHFNAVSELKNLDVLPDPRVYYTVHFYEPLLFTHQKAPWVPEAREFDQVLEYPGPFTGLRECLERYPAHAPAYVHLVGKRMDRDMLATFLQPAVEFQQRTGKPLYCGEFGVISTAPRESSARWYADFVGLLRQYDIGYGAWSYKEMDFGLVNAQGQVVREEIVRILAPKG